MAHNKGFGRVLYGLALACIFAAAAATAGAQDLPDGKGKEIVKDVCSQCHSLQQVVDSRMSPEEWKDTVGRMVSNGAPMAEEDIPVVIEYLSKSFPKDKAGKLNINKATGEEMAGKLHLTEEEAGAVVKYRQEHGPFHGWDDLGKVPGLDLKKLEPMKDSLDY